MAGKLYMLVGLPGSGKSTFAGQLKNKDASIIIHSSDKLREELFGDENSQDHNKDLFEELHRRIKSDLKDGRDVIYDATNINKKRRIAFLRELKNVDCYKECVLILTPYSSCIGNNFNRERTVPGYVLNKMYKNFQPPHISEGWDKVSIFTNFTLKDIENYTSTELFFGHYFAGGIADFNQENDHHTLTLGEHCVKAARYIKETLAPNNDLLFVATFFHDIGKIFTKSRYNSKGENDGNCHYYQHHCVGAYDSLFYTYNLGYSDVDMLHISNLIYYHMHPFLSWKQSDKAREKTKEIIRNEMYNEILLLHKADLYAH